MGLFRRNLRTLDQRAVLGLSPVRLHVAVAVGVEDAEFERINGDGDGELVHLAFSAKSSAVTPNPRIAVAGVRLVKTQYTSAETFGIVYGPGIWAAHLTAA